MYNIKDFSKRLIPALYWSSCGISYYEPNVEGVGNITNDYCDYCQFEKLIDLFDKQTTVRVLFRFNDLCDCFVVLV